MNVLKVFIYVIALLMISMGLTPLLPSKDFGISDPKWEWINHAIYNDHQDIDYAIIGSSRIWCAINPLLLSEELHGENVVNYGRNWLGREMDVIILERLIENHKVHNVIIEVGEMEGLKNFERDHDYYKYVIQPGEMVREFDIWRDSLKNNSKVVIRPSVKYVIKKFLGYVSEYALRFPRVKIQQLLVDRFRYDEDSQYRYFESHRGFINNKLYPMDRSFLNQYSQYQSLKRLSVQQDPSKVSLRYYRFMERIQNVCRQNNIKIYYAYTPKYRANLLSPRISNYLSDSGELLVPDLLNLYSINYWRNKTHLNEDGSNLYTKDIARLLTQGTKN